MNKIISIILGTLGISFSAYADPTNDYAKNIPQVCQDNTTFEQGLDCAKKYFFIAGEPINPRIIYDLVGWISDVGDQVVAIDVLGSQRSNRYFYDDLTVKNDGKYFSAVARHQHDSTYYSLRGITDNGVIVLHEADWNDEGSGVFNSLVLVRIREGAGFGDMASGQLKMNHRQIIIEKLGSMPLGDRSGANVFVEGNTITITRGENGTEKINITY